MKQSLKSLWFLAVGGAAAHAGTVIADFNDLAPGDLSGQLGGTGFAAAAWTNNTPNPAETFIDVVPGDLTAPAGTSASVMRWSRARRDSSSGPAHLFRPESKAAGPTQP